MRGGFDGYDYLTVEEVLKVCDGDPEVLGMMVLRYENYAKKCLYNEAKRKYGLDAKNLPVDDLMQDVWLNLVRTVRRNFRP